MNHHFTANQVRNVCHRWQSSLLSPVKHGSGKAYDKMICRRLSPRKKITGFDSSVSFRYIKPYQNEHSREKCWEKTCGQKISNGVKKKKNYEKDMVKGTGLRITEKYS